MHGGFLLLLFCKVSERQDSRVCIVIKRVSNNTALRKRLAGYVQSKTANLLCFRHFLKFFHMTTKHYRSDMVSAHFACRSIF